jgi:hypothetical protein
LTEETIIMKYNLIALACALLLAAGLSLTVTAGPLPDADSDTVADVHDNCSQKSNTNQADEDQDGYGQVCDGDFNQDGKVQLNDFITFKAAYEPNPYQAECDHNCDGKVQLNDFITFKALYEPVPLGPSGQSCAALADGSCPGNPPCP